MNKLRLFQTNSVVGTLLFLLTVIAIQLVLFQPTLSPLAQAAQSAPPIGENASAPGAVSGVVADSSGSPVEGLLVTAYLYQRNEWSPFAVGVTDAEGEYTIEGLSVGFYRVGVADVDGPYLETFFGGGYDINSATELSVAGELLPDINLQVAKGAEIRGTVAIHPEILPEVRDAYSVVYLIDLDTEEAIEHYGLSGLRSEPQTYEFRQLPPGSYRVCVLQSRALIDRTCHDGVVGHLEDSVPLSLAAGEVRAELNITLGAPSLYGQISGQLVDEVGEPLAGVTVIAQLHDLDAGALTISPCEPEAVAYSRYFSAAIEQTYCVETDQNGFYTIDSMIQGEYTIQFADEAGIYARAYYPTELESTDAALLTVNPGTSLEEVGGTLNPGGAITGNVAIQGRPLRSGCYVTAFRSDGNGFRMNVLSSIDLESGTYNISGLPTGTYSVTLSTQQGAFRPVDYQPSICQGPTQRVEVQAPQRVDSIDFDIAQGLFNGVLAGQVTSNGTPLAGISVGLLDTDDSYPAPIYQIETDSEGRYRIEGLGSEPLRLYFWDKLNFFFGQFHNQQSEREEAELIIVNHDETVTIDADLEPAGLVRGRIQDPLERYYRYEIWVERWIDTGELVYVPTDIEIDWRTGQFSVMLSPGRYRLGIFASSSNRGVPYDEPFRAEFTVDVEAGQVSDDILVVAGAGTPTSLELTAEPTLAPAVYLPLAVP